MTREDLAAHQADGGKAALFALYSLCRRRFLRAMDLLEQPRDRAGPLVRLGQTDPVDLAPLWPAWQELCRRYRDELYDPQTDLFAPTTSDPAQSWERFVHHRLFPTLVRDDELVRNLLRALGGLACRSPSDAAHAISQRFAEMTLPGAPPPWAPEEECD